MRRERLAEKAMMKNNVMKLKISKIGKISGLLIILLFGGVIVLAQVGNGTSSQQNKDTGNNSDQNLKSVARINPSTLAMEMNLPLMNYPGRNGNSLPVGFSYSSKIWRMESGMQWWYRLISGQPRYVTDINARFAERSAAGWTSSMLPPRIDQSSVQFYNQLGQPWSQNVLDEAGLNSGWQNILSGLAGNNNQMPCGINCTSWVYNCPPGQTSCPISQATISCGSYGVEWCETGGNGPTFPEPPPPIPLYYIKRLQVEMPDGSSHEFRESDTTISCGTNQTVCTPDMNGTYLAVDGSGMKLIKNSTGSILYLPNGSRYVFPTTGGGEGIFANQFIDTDGNKTVFEKTTAGNLTTNKWTDTLGREIVDAMPHNWITQSQTAGTKEFDLPGLDSDTQKYKLKWENLKPLGCENVVNDSSCTNELGQVGGTLEDQNQKLYYETRYFCRGNISDNLLVDTQNPDNPINEVLFPRQEAGIRPCNSFNILRNAQGQPILDGNGLAQPFASRFNPVVLSEVELPNGKKYVFKYNRYGEITRIIYPTGSFETFVYDRIPPVNGGNSVAYDQTNRGVVERRVYDSGGSLQQRWQYIAETGKITTIAPKGDDPLGNGMKTERIVYTQWSDGSNFGFSSPTVGLPIEEKVYAENDYVNPRSRTLTEYITKNSSNASRDARIRRTIVITIENNLALATMTETEYETPGEDGSTAPTDAEYFAHLNVKKTKGYHYAVLDLNTARTGDLGTIKNYFNNNLLASVSEADYIYNEDTGKYKARGIPSLPTETRVLNPQNLNQIIVKTQTVFDEQVYIGYNSGTLPAGLTDTWNDPQNDSTIPQASRALRAKPTTTKVWDNDAGDWIQSHTQYDQYGNVRKVWEVNEDSGSSRFAETIYSTDYGCAYPTRVNTPAPDPTNTHGTNEGSFATTTYDFMTGLTLTATNEFGQTTQTEYNDSMLRPTKVSGVGDFIIPITETYYDDTPVVMLDKDGNNIGDGTPISIKVRKQIDATNWNEAETYLDSLGRTIKTQAKDSQGDVFVETEYDKLSRVKRASNPYRQGDTKLWSQSRYDELGRAVESYAPAVDGLTGESLGITQYGISTAPAFVGTFVLTTDAAGKKSRAIANALGQLVRVDEPDSTGNVDALPQSTPTPNPSPSPTPPPDGGGCYNRAPGEPPQCRGSNMSVYEMVSTTYKYNAQGKMVEVTQGGQKRFFLYDSLGRLIRVRQPEQEVNQSLDKPDSVTGNNQWTAAFEYDVIGNLTVTKDANGTIITNTYDKAGRVKTRTYQNASGVATTPAVSFYYDGKGLDNPQTPNYAKGKLTKVTSSISETRYTKFDKFGRLEESEQRTPVGDETLANATAKVSKYKYNFSGALIEQEYPSGRVVKNEFEPDGDLSRIFGKANTNATERTYANGFSYTPDGRIQRLRLGNGRWESAKFNNHLQVTELALGTSDGNGSLWKLNYDYGELNTDGTTVNQTKNTGNIAKQTLSFSGLASPLVQTFKYDSLYRLREARETSGEGQSAPQTWKQTFSYDRFGNRMNLTQEGIPIVIDNKTLPEIDAATNRFKISDGYSYDKNGNLLGDPLSNGRQFIFNGENKQTEVKTAGGMLIGRYFYDGEGKRVKKIVYDEVNLPKEETVFVYDGMGKLVAEYSTQPQAQTPTTNYTITDQIGSPRVITDSNGNVTSRRDFMPFGEELAPDGQNRTTNQKYNTGDNIRQKFTGYQKDTETQLEFAEARYYNNSHGRFTAVDPLLTSGKSANPQSFNRYVYVDNDPINNTDPSGTCKAGQCPTTHSGKVYTRVENGSTRYNNEKPDDSWTEVPVGTDTTFVDDTDGHTYRVFNLGDAEGGSGWYQVSSEDSSDSVLPRRWYTHFYLGDEWEWPTETRGGRNTITIDGETDIEKYLDKRDDRKTTDLFIMTQNLNLGFFRLTPRITPINRQASVNLLITPSPDLGNKMQYFFGKATGEKNQPRTASMAMQLKSIGLSDTPANREYLSSVLSNAYYDPNSIVGSAPSKYNPFVTVTKRENLIMGPTGALKATTYWEGNRLTTMILQGAPVTKAKR